MKEELSQSAQEMPQADNIKIIQVKTEDAYQLLRLQILEETEKEFWQFLLKRASVYLAGVILAVGIFGWQGWDWMQKKIEEKVESEVSKRVETKVKDLDSQIQAFLKDNKVRIESQIEKTTEAGILARVASEDAKNTLDSLKSESRISESAIYQLRENATTSLNSLQQKIQAQQKEVETIQSYAKSYYENRRVDKFKLKESSDIIAVGTALPNDWIIFVRLHKPPLPGSIALQYHLYAQPPDSFFIVKDNILGFRWSDTLVKLEQQFLYVNYATHPELKDGFQALSLRQDGLFGDSTLLVKLNTSPPKE